MEELRSPHRRVEALVCVFHSAAAGVLGAGLGTLGLPAPRTGSPELPARIYVGAVAAAVGVALAFGIAGWPGSGRG